MFLESERQQLSCLTLDPILQASTQTIQILGVPSRSASIAPVLRVHTPETIVRN